MKMTRHGNQRGTGKHVGVPLLVILCLFLNSCTFGLLEGYRETKPVSITPVSWFKTDSDHLLMNTTIDVMKRHFSGLMVIKPLPGNAYRVVFLTEVGLKIFDMELAPGEKVNVHYFMDALDKKILIRTLSADLRLLLVQPADNRKIVEYDSSLSKKMIRYKHKRKRDYYGISASTGKPFQAWQVTGISKKARIDYFSRDGMEIDSVNIVHYHLDLRIGMHLIH
jgi:hypothetical protein